MMALHKPGRGLSWGTALALLLIGLASPRWCRATIESGLVVTTILEPWAAMAKFSFAEGGGATVRGSISGLKSPGAQSKAVSVYLYCEAEWARLEAIRASKPREKQCEGAFPCDYPPLPWTPPPLNPFLSTTGQGWPEVTRRRRNDRARGVHIQSHPQARARQG
jgi:hypothetical protein|eukprot:SAG25_NODE_93_length_16012_cov_22.660341_6_plen_164_part_00